ncbi:DUF488 family protein [Melittangium boletus]|uniref:DNA repair protein n=1 Tax=Melittangium boletus DSM 14713 TaxID=1294270 RepID=A0A286NVC6_9BACT|nr:DUF488 domain-containing protein [Melittangium boletus]ATB27077.1 DNA repair protein [Melittangium boletus DSM 14713]
MSTERPRRRAPGWARARIYTVGHSTRSGEQLVDLLQTYGIRTLVDIRTVPRSRTNPQFNQDTLPRTLAEADIRYVHLPRLGGLRRARKDSPNSAWRNASFRGYADYMRTDEFARGLEELRELTPDGPLALMCAEAVRWRCHRSLVADALYARGVEVLHISSRTRATPHTLTPFAQLHGRQVLYPGSQEGASSVVSARGRASV